MFSSSKFSYFICFTKQVGKIMEKKASDMRKMKNSSINSNLNKTKQPHYAAV